MCAALTLTEQVKQIANDVAAVHADAVDREARFLHEAIAALKQAGLMSAYVPQSLGGAGVSLRELVVMCDTLARACASTAMIFAMHQIQVITIVDHAPDDAWFSQYLRDLVQHQYLIASVTSEVNVGGEMRRSQCAVESDGQRYHVVKDATTISYGAQADDLLLTARRNAEAGPSDQVLILLRKGDFTLEQKGNWDTMGMRGTCSLPFLVTASGDAAQIMKVPFGDMSARTVVPVSHLLWGGCWSGCASAAVNKARAFVRKQARSKPVPYRQPLPVWRNWSACCRACAAVEACLHEYEVLSAREDAATGPLSSIGYSVRMNNLKIDATEELPRIVQKPCRSAALWPIKTVHRSA
jgi:acyl-CoA dehydrogenase